MDSSALRVDLYGTVHKALRARLFDLGIELDRTDFGKPLEVAVALGAYRRTMGFIHEHHRHENSFLQPALVDCGAVFDSVSRDHERAEATLAGLDELVGSLERTADQGRHAGVELCTHYRGFLIEYLAHMHHEETAVNAALWQRYTDGELMALRGRLQSTIPPARFGEWLEIMLPALNFDERTGMLSGIKANAPEPAFAAASAIASRVLGSAGWEAVRAHLEPSQRR